MQCPFGSQFDRRHWSTRRGVLVHSFPRPPGISRPHPPEQAFSWWLSPHRGRLKLSSAWTRVVLEAVTCVVYSPDGSKLCFSTVLQDGFSSAVDKVYKSLPGIKKQFVWISEKGYLFMNTQFISWIPPNYSPLDWPQALSAFDTNNETRILIGSPSGMITLITAPTSMLPL